MANTNREKETEETNLSVKVLERRLERPMVIKILMADRCSYCIRESIWCFQLIVQLHSVGTFVSGMVRGARDLVQSPESS